MSSLLRLLAGAVASALALLALAWTLGACGATDSPAAPALVDLPGAQQAAAAAEQSIRDARWTLDSSRLAGHLAGAALALYRADVERLSRLGVRIETDVVVRVIAAREVGAAAVRVVLGVTGRERRVGPLGAGPWAGRGRQWEADLAAGGGRWLVTAARDLPPDRWLS